MGEWKFQPRVKWGYDMKYHVRQFIVAVVVIVIVAFSRFLNAKLHAECLFEGQTCHNNLTFRHTDMQIANGPGHDYEG